jgi:molybdopterin converting factor small subunit
MFKATVQMFGLPKQITALPDVEVDLSDQAGVQQLTAALNSKIPALEGSVILPGTDRLTDNYAFVINGEFHLSDSDVRIKNGDRIVLILLATGG